MRPLVILRPEPGASATATRARDMGLDARTIPLFEIMPLNWAAPDPKLFDGLLLTSANAVRHGGGQMERLKGLPVHAVGPATAEAAQHAGFVVESVGDGGVDRLDLPSGKKLLHLAGRDHRPTGAAQTIPVYEAQPTERPAALDALGKCVVAVHSPRAGQRLAELVSDRRNMIIAAISPAAAGACGDGWEQVRAAPEPQDESLLALAARLCESR